MHLCLRQQGSLSRGVIAPAAAFEAAFKLFEAQSELLLPLFTLPSYLPLDQLSRSCTWNKCKMSVDIQEIARLLQASLNPSQREQGKSYHTILGIMHMS